MVPGAASGVAISGMVCTHYFISRHMYTYMLSTVCKVSQHSLDVPQTVLAMVGFLIVFLIKLGSDFGIFGASSLPAASLSIEWNGGLLQIAQIAGFSELRHRQQQFSVFYGMGDCFR